MNKELLARQGIELATDFCQRNKLPQPKLTISFDPNEEVCQRIKRFATCGYYRNSVVFVGVPLCARPNERYSWPGFIADRTPYGVIQHELGHHIDQVFSGVDIYRDRSTPLFSHKVNLYSREEKITGYCPNVSEWFAEIVRLFITNPDLLRLLRPRAYEALVDAGLRHRAERRTYRQVLKRFDAPPYVYERATKWIAKSATT